MMNQTEAMVMEKKSPGLMSTLTNTAVRVKRIRMTSRLPRIRTISGMLFGSVRGRVGIAGLGPGEGRRAKSFIPALDSGGPWKDPEGGEGGWEGFPLDAPPRAPHRPGPRWSCLSKGGGTQGAGLGLSPGAGLSPLVQEGVEECEEQQR